MTRIAFFMPSLAGGGAEKVTLELCAGLAELGYAVELILAHADGDLANTGEEASPASMADLGRRRTLAALVPLTRHLRRNRPDVIFAVLTHASVIAVIARFLSRSSARLIILQHVTMTIDSRSSPRLRDRCQPLLCSIFYRAADVVGAVSAGVADDLARSAGLSRSLIHVIPNPIDYQKIVALAAMPVPPNLLPRTGEKLIVAAGRLGAQKDFENLLRAVVLLDFDYRLVILGEGPERGHLERLISQFDLTDRVVLPGYVNNPYPVFRAADLFVLSSRWEGLPTVLLEVMAFDTAIVATDCPSGPREILEDGRYGMLVPAGESRALANAIEVAVERPPTSNREAVRARYGKSEVIRHYDELIHCVLR